MIRLEFEQQLGDALAKAHVPQAEIEHAVQFFGESIADRMEDGMSEEEAVASLGSISDIALQVIQDLPAVPKAVASASNKASSSTKVLAIILTIILIPIWLPIVAGIFATAVSLYLASWAIILSIWSVAVSLVLAPVAGIVAFIGGCTMVPHQIAAGLLALASSLVACAVGLALFLGILWVTKTWAILTGRFFKWLKSLFVKDRDAADPDEAYQAQRESFPDGTYQACGFSDDDYRDDAYQAPFGDDAFGAEAFYADEAREEGAY